MNIAIRIGIHVQTVRINSPRLRPCRAKIIRRLQIRVTTHSYRAGQRTNVIVAAGIIITHGRKGLHIKVRYRYGRTYSLRAISISQTAGDIEHSGIILRLDFCHTRFLGRRFFLLFLFFCRKFIPLLVNCFLVVGLGRLAGCRYLCPSIYRYDSQTFATDIADRSLQRRSICNGIIFTGLIGIISCRARTAIQNVMVNIVFARKRNIAARKLRLIGYSQYAVCSAVKYINHRTNSRCCCPGGFQVTIHRDIALVHTAVNCQVAIRIQLSLTSHQYAGMVVQSHHIHGPGQRYRSRTATFGSILFPVLHHIRTGSTVHIIISDLGRIGQVFNGFQRLGKINTQFFQFRSILFQVLIKRLASADQSLQSRRVFGNIFQISHGRKEIRHMLPRFLPLIGGKVTQQLIFNILYILDISNQLVQTAMTTICLCFKRDAVSRKRNSIIAIAASNDHTGIIRKIRYRYGSINQRRFCLAIAAGSRSRNGTYLYIRIGLYSSYG